MKSALDLVFQDLQGMRRITLDELQATLGTEFGESFIHEFECHHFLDKSYPVASLFKILNGLHYHLPNEAVSKVYQYLLSLDEVKNKFRFIGDTFDQLVKNGMYLLLEMPLIDTDNASYEQVLIKIFQKNDVRAFRKRIGRAILQYGTRVLNNLILLREFMNIADELDHLLQLDHGIRLDERFVSLVVRKNFVPIFAAAFGPSTIFRLLEISSIENDVIMDSLAMIKQVLDHRRDAKEILAGKHTWHKIHAALIPETRFGDVTHHEINQSKISAIHGWGVDGYIFEVIKSTEDLARTSVELKHCVHMYRWIGDKNNSYIFNLLKDGKRHYTIQIAHNDKGQYFYINQFKGYRNNAEMEGLTGQTLREKIINLLSEKTGLPFVSLDCCLRVGPW